MLKIVEYFQRSEDVKRKEQDIFSESGMNLKLRNSESTPICLVFACQYSAGKSSILKMITNRDDIATGAGITTQYAHSYDWNGLEVIDTPGIHTKLRPDHDEISYDAIASADMLVFVVTNELFDSHIANISGNLLLIRTKLER